MSFLDTLPDELKKKIVDVVKVYPPSIDAFNSLYFHAIQSTSSTQASEEPEAKKRKTIQQSPSSGSSPGSAILSLPQLTFQSPVRKKLDLVFAIDKSSKKPMLALIKESEALLTISDLTTTNIFYGAFLPVAEKPNLEMLTLFILQSSQGSEPIVSSFKPETLISDLVGNGGLINGDRNYKTRIIRQAAMFGFKIEDPFAAREAFYVDAHKGSKPGTLYFLPNNIIFGFKKPILIYESKDIKSITYSSITRITFNVTLLVEKQGKEERIEFSMIDQSEYNRIDAYVKAKEVVDNSMAEELKAKSTKKEAEIEEEDENAERELDEDSDDQEDGNYEIEGSSSGSDSEGSYESDDN